MTMPSRWIYSTSATAVVAVLLGVVIGANLGDDEGAEVTAQSSDGLSSGVSNVGQIVEVSRGFDSFERPDDPADLGLSAGGEPWNQAVGTWGVQAGQAFLAGPIGGRNLAVVDPGRSDGRVQVQVAVASEGAGLVFRYQDPFNYWAVVAVPAYATWTAIKVVDGREQVAADTGLSAAADGTSIGVRLDGETIDVVLNSRVIATVTDAALVRATGVGLTARDDIARLDDLRLMMADPEGPGLLDSPLPRVEGDVDDAATAPGETPAEPRR